MIERCDCGVTEQCECADRLADELEKTLDALERIQDYAWSIMHDQLEGQDELDPAWVWRVAHDAIHPCTCDHSTWGGAHDTTCPRFSDEYKVR